MSEALKITIGETCKSECGIYTASLDRVGHGAFIEIHDKDKAKAEQIRNTIRAALEAKAEPVASPDAVAAMERAKKLPVWDGGVPHELHKELDIIFRHLSAPPTTAEGEAKPFGWLGKWNNGTYDFFTTQEEIDKWSASGALQVTPIYTAPPSTAEAQARALEGE